MKLQYLRKQTSITDHFKVSQLGYKRLNEPLFITLFIQLKHQLRWTTFNQKYDSNDCFSFPHNLFKKSNSQSFQ